jgi:hypothetical protein
MTCCDGWGVQDVESHRVITPRGGNVFADLDVQYPNAHARMADLMGVWNSVLDEPIPDEWRELLGRLEAVPLNRPRSAR